MRKINYNAYPKTVKQKKEKRRKIMTRKMKNIHKKKKRKKWRKNVAQTMGRVLQCANYTHNIYYIR